jgi:hypothetical protein
MLIKDLGEVMNLMTHGQRKTAVRAEVAQEMLGNVIAHYSDQIALEEAKATPDAKVIELAEAEKLRVRQVRSDMDINDRDQVEALIAEYKPIVRRLYA